MEVENVFCLRLQKRISSSACSAIVCALATSADLRCCLRCPRGQELAESCPFDDRRRAARDYGSGLYMTPLVTKSLDYLEQHYRDNIALDDLAQHLQISKHLTNKMFMKYFGHDVDEVLQMIRIHAAGSLLEISDASVTDIAFLCGYDSVTTFLSHFKKWKHMAPSDYRKLSAAEYMA